MKPQKSADRRKAKEAAASALVDVGDAPEYPFPYPNVELVETDGEPLDSDWQRLEINLLTESIKFHFRDRNDFYAGGNMFIYYSVEQAKARDFKGPDFFFVWGATPNPLRPYWAVWEEKGLLPSVIIELLSPSTAKEDLTTKKEVYQNVLRTPEYYCYDPDKQSLHGWDLKKGRKYEPLELDERGWIFSEELGLWLGTWEGTFSQSPATWLRFFTPGGKVVQLKEEFEEQRAEAEKKKARTQKKRAEAAEKRAQALEVEVARLKAQLKGKSHS